MPRGSHDGRIYTDEVVDKRGKAREVYRVRVRYTDPAGRQRELKRTPRPNNYVHACKLRRKLLDLAQKKSGQAVDVERLTFADLARHFEENYAVPAKYVDDLKVAGMRSLPTVKRHLQTFRDHFGDKLLRAITHGDVQSFRALRLSTPVQFHNKAGAVTRERPRSLASVHRELSLLRRIFNVGVAAEWLTRNPVTAGDSLISIADERSRERILSFVEEQRLYAACKGKRKHLRAIIVAALDTGLRKGELLKLRWSAVRLDERTITAVSYKGRRRLTWVIGMTARLARELEEMHKHRPPGKDPLVFGYGEVARGFAGACRAAGITGLRFHDLRHTCATRLVRQGVSLERVGKQLGHTQPGTTWRYVNPDAQIARENAEALDALYAQEAPRDVQRADDVIEAPERDN